MKITFYSKQGCGWCNEVRDLFNEKQIPFEEKEVRTNVDYYKEMVELSGQEMAPTVNIDGVILADSDRSAIETYLLSKK